VIEYGRPMKTTLILMGMVFSVHAYAQTQGDDSMFRPYVSCVSVKGTTAIEVVQNVDKSDEATPFQITIEKITNGKTAKFENVVATRIPNKNKNVLDYFEGVSVKDNYRFQLTIARLMNDEGHIAYLIDSSGRRVVNCNYHITFGVL
jgi:hypothetical protein